MRIKDIYLNQVRSAFFGLAIGDALGVPVEFKSREYLREHPVIDMNGYGTFYQPAGTWSDDSSLAFCLAEALIDGFDANRIAQYLVVWCRDNFWTARGVVFDIGYGTRFSLTRYGDGTWIDDSSVAYCLAEAFIVGIDANRIAQHLVDWYSDNFWTARGVVFCRGYGTRLSLTRYGDGEQAELAGSFDENSNGNGSL